MLETSIKLVIEVRAHAAAAQVRWIEYPNRTKILEEGGSFCYERRDHFLMWKRFDISRI